MIRKSRMKLIGLGAALCAVAGLGIACTHTAPAELVDARQAFREAQAGPAARDAKSHLDTARAALLRAEESFANDGDTRDTRDLAYVAQRLAEISEAQAKLKLTMAERDKAKANLELARADAEKTARERIASAEQLGAEAQFRADAAQRANQELRGEKEAAESDADRERQARAAAETREIELREQLARIGEVTEESRGTVIVIPGSVLFTSGSSKILPTARERLTTLANSINQEMSGRSIVIEGHTDSQGSTASNQRLSEARAESVKRFLVDHGVESNRIETVGMGEEHPTADNGTSEGRANNRRVEVIIQTMPTS